MSLDLEPRRRFLVCLWLVSQEGAVAVGVGAVACSGAGSNASAQTFAADGPAAVGPAAVGPALQTRARTPDARPPGTTGCGTPDGTIFPAGFVRGRSLKLAARFSQRLPIAIPVAVLADAGIATPHSAGLPATSPAAHCFSVAR
jgi:hypothetical protein